MKVLVADDHEFVRGGIVSELSALIPDATFLQAGDAGEVKEVLASNMDISMAILDLYMPGANQYALVQDVCETFPQILVIVLTSSEAPKDMRAVMAAGAKGYIAKTSGRDIVLNAVRLVLAGGTYFPGEMLSAPEEQSTVDTSTLQKQIATLTDRQKEVLTHLLKGLSNKEIANTLNISENTIKIHVTAILKALPFRSRTQVIAAVDPSDLDF